MPRDARPDSRAVSLVFPIILIVVGGLLLYAKWQPEFHPWPVIWTYWPLILILVGLGKIWDSVRMHQQGEGASRFPIGSTIGILVFVVVITVLFARGRGYTGSHRDWAEGSGHSAETVDLQGAKNVAAKIDMDAGQLNIDGGAAHLLDGQFNYTGNWERPHVEYHVANGAGDLQISQQSSGPSIGHHDNTWRLSFANDVPIDLRINMGAGQGNLKLRGVEVTRLELHIGAGEVNLDLTGPRASDLTADIQGGVGHARILLPKDVGVAATAHGAIGSVRVHGLQQSNGEYVNEAYGKSAHTIHLTVQGGIGEIDLDQE